MKTANSKKTITVVLQHHCYIIAKSYPRIWSYCSYICVRMCSIYIHADMPFIGSNNYELSTCKASGYNPVINTQLLKRSSE